MDREAAKLIRANVEALKKENLDPIYEQCTEREMVKAVTSVFLRIGVDPLKYVTKVVNYMLAHSTIKEAIIGDKITHIGKYAFAYCLRLEKVQFGQGVSEIGDHAFAHCGSLKSITIPGNIKSIGETAFNDCDHLEHVSLLPGVEVISDGAFFDCKGLKTIDIPDTVTYLGDFAFKECGNIFIHYGGTTDNWQKLVLSKMKFLGTRYTCHCSDGTVQNWS